MAQFSNQAPIFRRASLVFATSTLWVTPLVDARTYKFLSLQWSLVAGAPAALGAVSQWDWYRTSWSVNAREALDDAGRPARPIAAAYQQILPDGSAVAVGAGTARGDIWILDGAMQFTVLPGDGTNPVSSDLELTDNSKSAFVGVLTIASNVDNLSLFSSAYGG